MRLQSGGRRKSEPERKDGKESQNRPRKDEIRRRWEDGYIVCVGPNREQRAKAKNRTFNAAVLEYLGAQWAKVPACVECAGTAEVH